MNKPIDPRDYDGILSAVREAVHDQMSTHDRLMIANDYATNQATQIAINATAFAVLPEGYVAVPVADVKNLLDGMYQYSGPHEDWDFLKYAIPESETT